MRGNTGVWTKDVTETDFTAERINNNPQIVYDNKAIYPNQYPPTGSPVVPQNSGSYPQAGVPYQTGGPYQPPQAPNLYTQPQGTAGSFTHQPQTQSGQSPYPQV